MFTSSIIQSFSVVFTLKCGCFCASENISASIPVFFVQAKMHNLLNAKEQSSSSVINLVTNITNVYAWKSQTIGNKVLPWRSPV